MPPTWLPWQYAISSKTTTSELAGLAAAARAVTVARHIVEDWQPGCQTRRDYPFRAAAIDFSTARCRSSFRWTASI